MKQISRKELKAIQINILKRVADFCDQKSIIYFLALLWMSQHASPVYVLNSSNVKWYKIDDEYDLKYTGTMTI